MLLFGTLAVLWRGVPQSSVLPLRIFAVGMLFYIAADLNYDYMTIHSTYLGGDPVDTLWMVAVTFVCLAAACQLRARRERQRRAAAAVARRRAGRPSLPYLAVVSSYVLLLVIGLRSVRFNPLGGMLLGAVLLTLLVAIRQYIALRDYGRLAARYRDLAAIDGITGLFNRRHFMETAEAAFAHAQRLGQPFAALMIDVDNFKQINDVHGHIAGDQVLGRAGRGLPGARAARRHRGTLRRRRVHHHGPGDHQPARDPARRPADPAGPARPRPRRQAAGLTASASASPSARPAGTCRFC